MGPKKPENPEDERVERLIAEMVEHGFLVVIEESVNPYKLGPRPPDDFPVHQGFWDFLKEDLNGQGTEV